MAAVPFATILCQPKYPQLGVIPPKNILKDKGTASHLFLYREFAEGSWRTQCFWIHLTFIPLFPFKTYIESR